MLAPAGNAPDRLYFHPATKCCTFQPNLPNFLAGQVLANADPDARAGRLTLEARIARGVAVMPSKVGSGGVFGTLYRVVPDAFGRAPSLRCSFLTDAGGCGVWAHRPGVCATWFCKHVRGATGFRFWHLADKLLREVEQQLACWCMAELDVGAEEVQDPERFSAPHVSELAGEIDWARHRALWSTWAGREAEFYRACADLVAPLSWEQVLGRCGPRVRILATLLHDAYAQLVSDRIPERLRLREFVVSGAREGRFSLVTYSQYDPVLMPEDLARVLPYFDGRLTEDALSAIHEAEGLNLSLALVRRLVDFAILERCEEPEPTAPLHFVRR